MDKIEKTLLIITSEALIQAFVDFIAHKQNQGFTVAIIAVETIGQTSTDIKSYIDSKYDDLKNPFYVLIGGNLTHVAGWLRMYPRSGARYPDAYYALKGTQWICSIGRLPAADSDEMKKMCKAVKEYEQGHNFHYKSSLLTVTATQPNIDFLPGIASVLGHIASVIGMDTHCYNKQNIVDEISADRNEFINYMGHGKSNAWALKVFGSGSKCTFEHLFSPDIPLLSKGNTHVLSWACNTANISHSSCFGTEFLKQGAISFWGAAAMTFGESNRAMAKRFWEIYTSTDCPQYIGNIYFQIVSECRDTDECVKYMLLGDPTLQIK